MLIYFNGDSFTAGVNLFDEIFPGWPGNFTNEELTTRSVEIKKFVNLKGLFSQRYIDYDRMLQLDSTLSLYDKPFEGSVKVSNNLIEAEIKRSYPAIIEQLDNNITTINKAVPGASIGGICVRTVVDLLELKSRNITVDRVIIQITSISRYEIFDHTHNRLMYDRPIGNFLTSEDNNIGNAVAQKYTDEDYVIKYLYNLCSVVETVRSITGKDPIFIDSANKHIEKMLEKTNNTLLENDPMLFEQFQILRKHSLIDSIRFNFMENIALSIPEKGYVYDEHYSFHTHNAVAKHILDLLEIRELKEKTLGE